MVTKMELSQVRSSAERLLGGGFEPGREPAESVVSNRRRAVTGLIITLVLLAGVTVWQYFDDQAAFPASADTGEVPVIGSTALESDTATP